MGYRKKIYPDGTRSERWFKNRRLHRIDGPAFIYYDVFGTISEKQWRQHGKLHRTDGPAYISYNGQGKLQREQWYVNGIEGNPFGGPSSTCYNSFGNIITEEWGINDIYHRIGAPAAIDYDDEGNVENEEWFIFGVRVEAATSLQEQVGLDMIREAITTFGRVPRPIRRLLKHYGFPDVLVNRMANNFKAVQQLT